MSFAIDGSYHGYEPREPLKVGELLPYDECACFKGIHLGRECECCDYWEKRQ